MGPSWRADLLMRDDLLPDIELLSLLRELLLPWPPGIWRQPFCDTREARLSDEELPILDLKPEVI